MIDKASHTPYLEQPFPLYFILGLILVNCIAMFPIDIFHIGAFLSFFYIIITPGLLLLPFLISKKLAPMFGLVLSVALSLLTLMLVGLGLNTVLPVLGVSAPLSTLPLLIAFDAIVYILLILNYLYKKDAPFEFHNFNVFNWIIAGSTILLPIAASLGAIILNNGGSNFLTMLALGGTFVLVPLVVFSKNKINPSIPPLTLYMIALSFLLMNSLRGWFITGHDILLEYHVFDLTNTAHLWNMDFYRDPYMACLSLTIFPTYLVQLIHVSPAYIFKFFTQFIGALPVVMIYYIAKEYVSERIAFLAAFLYITFPTFMIDMMFLNRQGMAFLFYGAFAFILFTEHFDGWKRTLTLFLLGIGIIVSHYSTSYVAIAILISTYCVNYTLRFIVNTKKPLWLFRLTNKIANKKIYKKPVLLRLPLVLGLLAAMVIWSTFITKTSTSLVRTINQIVLSVTHPFSNDGYTGPAKYSLFQSQEKTPQELLDQFRTQSVKDAKVATHQSAFFPQSIVEQYSTWPVLEQVSVITSFGEKIQSTFHISLTYVFGLIKQFYAKILQIFLLIGLMGCMFGYGFKKNLLRSMPVEYLAISISGIIVMVGQTVLPGNAIDYGLLRLFQQNLIFLMLPIMLGLLSISMLITRNHKGQLVICTSILLFFFAILSGFFPQLTGGARAPLALDNYGLYYDSYYVHAEEVSGANWLAKNGDHRLSIQAAHFSDIKMIAYGHIAAYIELVPETTKKVSYVYLNYDNVKTDNIIEIVSGNVVYYHFPMDFLDANKNLIYNNGGAEIYR